MSSTTYGFVTVNDHDDFSGDGQLTFSVTPHTGRVGRSKQFDLVNDSGDQATITVNQSAEGYILELDHFEDGNGNTVAAIGTDGGLYYAVGYANTSFFEMTEDIGTSQTDVNDEVGGAAWTQGYTIIEANGAVHTGQLFEASIPWGTDAQYTFRVPINFNKTNQRIEIMFSLTDDVHVVQASVIQNGY